MLQADILSEFERLSIFQQLDTLKSAVQIIEQHIQSYIKKPDGELSLAEAAQMLLVDYEQDEELTAFTALDGEDFHVEW